MSKKCSHEIKNGDPVCPCRMKNVRVVDGRYIETIDHGPAPITSGDNFWKILESIVTFDCDGVEYSVHGDKKS